MARTANWLFKLPADTRTKLAEATLQCMKSHGTTQKEFRKLGKTDPKKAAKLKKKLVQCMVKKLRKL